MCVIVVVGWSENKDCVEVLFLRCCIVFWLCVL